MKEHEFDAKWRAKAKKLWDFLETRPKTIPQHLRVLVNECRKEARAIRGDDDFPTWKLRCEEKEIPLCVKNNGFNFPFPKTENIYERWRRKNMRKGIKHGQTSTRKGIEDNVTIPVADMRIKDIKALMESLRKSQALIELTGEVEDE